MAAGGGPRCGARERGLGRLPDRQLFARAIDEGRIVVTFDLDFGEVAEFAASGRLGVVLLRLHSVRKTHMRDRLRVAIAEAAEALREGAVVLVEDARIRIRRMALEDEG